MKNEGVSWAVERSDGKTSKSRRMSGLMGCEGKWWTQIRNRVDLNTLDVCVHLDCKCFCQRDSVERPATEKGRAQMIYIHERLRIRRNGNSQTVSVFEESEEEEEERPTNEKRPKWPEPRTDRKRWHTNADDQLDSRSWLSVDFVQRLSIHSTNDSRVWLRVWQLFIHRNENCVDCDWSAHCLKMLKNGKNKAIYQKNGVTCCEKSIQKVIVMHPKKRQTSDYDK